jgi:aspartyl-tRNA(Asn)/glutamyl-tRNA(Gln) amidotransferase subunit B
MAEKPSILDRYPHYKTDIGIEVHVQLNTATKIFCSCSNAQTDKANEYICPVCCGHPGVLPVLNKEVVTNAIKAGLATNSEISPRSIFARKHYFYPDLPKNYQITQDKLPICTEGHLTITKEDGTEKKIRLIRIHIEEDAGKNIHAALSNESFVDFNRTGTPLLEIVSYPDIESAEEAKAYLKALRSLVQALGISTGNMEEGSFRADTNVSVRKKDSSQLGTRCELKNINSFKFIGDAVEYEIERQIGVLEEGGQVRQQTLLWDTKNRVTQPMRSKEEAADYRYFQDPDLPIIEVDEALLTKVKETMPELPAQKFKRLQTQYGLTPYEADILIEESVLAQYYEQAAQYKHSKTLINWVLRDLMGYLKEHKVALPDCKITPQKMAALIALIDEGTINTAAGQLVFAEVAQTGTEPAEVVKQKGLQQIGDVAELEKIVQEIITANPQMVAQYKSGKDKLFGFFVGQAMQKTQGKGDPTKLSELFKKHLA